MGTRLQYPQIEKKKTTLPGVGLEDSFELVILRL